MLSWIQAPSSGVRSGRRAPVLRPLHSFGKLLLQCSLRTARQHQEHHSCIEDVRTSLDAIAFGPLHRNQIEM